MPVQIDNCIFSGNVAQENGGAVGGAGGAPIITNSLFLDNVAVKGAAIDAAYGGLTLENCTFAGNIAQDGGAVYISNIYENQISGCTFTGNAAGRGGAITVETSTNAPVIISNSIMAYSSEGEGFYWDGLGTLELANIDIYGNSGGDWVGEIQGQFGLNGNISLDPLFCNVASRDFTLATSSPCLPENNPDGVLIGACGWGCDYPTSTGEIMPEQPSGLWLHNYPNPFNPRTRISFKLDTRARVDLSVYDLTGRLVLVLERREFLPGHHALNWNGTDEYGHAVPSGTYLVRLLTKWGVETRKVTLLH